MVDIEGIEESVEECGPSDHRGYCDSPLYCDPLLYAYPCTRYNRDCENSDTGNTCCYEYDYDTGLPDAPAECFT